MQNESGEKRKGNRRGIWKLDLDAAIKRKNLVDAGFQNSLQQITSFELYEALVHFLGIDVVH